MSLEHELRRALRAEDPGDEFTARVLGRVRQDRASRAAQADGQHDARGEARSASRPGMTDAHAASAATAPGVGKSLTSAAAGEPDASRPVVLSWPKPATEVEASAGRRTPTVPAAGASSSQRAGRSRTRWIWVSTMAASLLVSAAGGVQWVKHRQELAEGERARAEVMAAFRLTSEKLSLVRHAVASEGAAAPGAGERR